MEAIFSPVMASVMFVLKGNWITLSPAVVVCSMIKLLLAVRMFPGAEYTCTPERRQSEFSNDAFGGSSEYTEVQFLNLRRNTAGR